MLPYPSLDQILGVVRVLVPVLITAAVAFKWVPEAEAGSWTKVLTDGGVGLVTLGFAIWALLRNRQASQIDKVAKMKGVKKIIVNDPALVGGPKTSLHK